MTATHNYERTIDLIKLADEPDTCYNAELFPAVQIKTFKPIHINVFASGKIIVCGVKDELQLVSIKYYLDCTLCKFFK